MFLPLLVLLLLQCEELCTNLWLLRPLVLRIVEAEQQCPHFQAVRQCAKEFGVPEI